MQFERLTVDVYTGFESSVGEAMLVSSDSPLQ